MYWWTIPTNVIGNLGLPVGLIIIAIFACRSVWQWLNPKLDGLIERGGKAIDAHVELVDALKHSVGEINHNQEVIVKCADNTTESLRQVASMVKAHDDGQRNHHTACTETGIAVKRLQTAALEACDGIEDVCKTNNIDVGTRIQRVRDALLRGSTD